MSILGGLTRAVVGIVTLPVSLTADVVTLGGVLSNRGKTYTPEHLQLILDNVRESIKPERT